MNKMSVHSVLPIILFILVSVNGNGYSQTIDVHTKIINNLLDNEDRPVVINFYSCWSIATNVQYMHRFRSPTILMNNSIDMETMRLEEFPEIWFVVPMNCNSSWDYLLQVN